MGREEDTAAAGWLRYGEVHCGQGTRTGVKSGTSSSGHSLEPGGMGWKGAEATWVVARLEHTELPTADVLVSSLSAGGSQSGKLKVGHAPPPSTNPVRCGWYQVTTCRGPALYPHQARGDAVPSLPTEVGQGGPCPCRLLSVLPLAATQCISSRRIQPFLSHTGYLLSPTFLKDSKKAATVVNQVFKHP